MWLSRVFWLVAKMLLCSCLRHSGWLLGRCYVMFWVVARVVLFGCRVVLKISL